MSRSNKYKRERRLSQSIRDRILILCGGETEVIYFDLYKEKYKEYFKNIEVKLKKKDESPLRMVESAIKRKREGEYHEIWVLFDKDAFDCFDEAIALAEKNGIHCAFSNEAFEYWFVLHIENTWRYIDRPALNKMVGAHLGIPNYDKNKRDVEKASRTFMEKPNVLEKVEERARKIHEQHQNNYWNRKPNKPNEWKSCTTVYLLTKRLRKGISG